MGGRTTEKPKVLVNLQPELASFAQVMQERLDANDHKGGWRDMTPRQLMRRLLQEAKELDYAIGDALERRAETVRTATREAADVASFAMMIADVLVEKDKT